jgi:hypothetical protein
VGSLRARAQRDYEYCKGETRELWKKKRAFAPRIDQISVIFFFFGRWCNISQRHPGILVIRHPKVSCWPRHAELVFFAVLLQTSKEIDYTKRPKTHLRCHKRKQVGRLRRRGAPLVIRLRGRRAERGRHSG